MAAWVLIELAEACGVGLPRLAGSSGERMGVR